MPQSTDTSAMRSDAVADHDDLHLVFDLAPVGLCITRKRTIQRCNTAFAAMFGYEPAELQGRSLECLYPAIFSD